MRNRTLIGALFATLGALACGGPTDNGFFDPTGASGKPATGGSGGSGTGGSGGTAGSKATGGSAGSSGSKSTGGTSGTSGASGTGGTGGDAMGGTGDTGTGGSTGGTSGTAGDAMGGTGDTGAGGTTGGTAGDAMGGTGDTGTGGTVGGTAGTGGTGGTKGGAGGSAGSSTDPDCSALQEQYAAALAAAQVCNADSGKDQCTQAVKSNLTCGCDVFVNPDNEDAIKELEALRKQAGTRCAVACPAIACIVPESGTCMPGDSNSKSGHCGSLLATPL